MANAIDKAQWAEIEQKLKGYFGSANFRLGEHTITVERGRVSENRLALCVYIDGTIKGSWMTDDNDPYSPIVRQVWRQRRHACHKPKDKARLIKSFGKRRAKEIFPRLDDVLVMYDPIFNTTASLIRQFKKIDGLTLVSNTHETQ